MNSPWIGLDMSHRCANIGLRYTCPQNRVEGRTVKRFLREIGIAIALLALVTAAYIGAYCAVWGGLPPWR